MLNIKRNDLAVRILKNAIISATALVSYAASTMIPAVAGNVTAAGLTSGIGVYAPLPEGLYLLNFLSDGRRDSSPGVSTNFYDPFFFYQSKLKILNGAVSFIVAPTVFNINVGSSHVTGFYNTYFGSQITWDLGNNIGVGYRISGYAPAKTDVGYNFGTIEQRAGVTYTGHGYDLTANFMYGSTEKDRTSGLYDVPDYGIVDLTATKKFGKLEAGLVGYGSTDMTHTSDQYKKQSQFALGGLVAYDFGTLIVQAKVTSDVYQRNYGGYDRRGWLTVIYPLYVAQPSPSADRQIEKRH